VIANVNGDRSWVEGILKPTHPCKDGDFLCLDVGEVPLLENIRRGLIDPDTPEEAMTKKNADGKEWQLVVSVRIDHFSESGSLI
jgi:hypothetical protein